MMRLKNYAILFLLPALATASRAADSPPAPAARLGQNAALQYWQAFAAVPQNAADAAAVMSWQTDPLNDKTAELLKRSETALHFLHAGAAMPQCDWGLDYSEGQKLVLPHIIRSRELARIACLRIRYELKQHQPAAAVQDACDVLTFARHMAHDPIIISMLVDYSMEQWAIDAIAAQLRDIDSPSLERLNDHLAHLPAPAILGSVPALAPQSDALTKALDANPSALTRLALLQAAIAIVTHGPDALKDFPDPITHKPFEYKAAGGAGSGFVLTSAVTLMGKPVTLSVGTAPGK